MSSTDWTIAARQLIDAIPAEEHRQSLIDYFEETAAFIEFEQGQARPLAEQQAFGQLMFEMLRRGIDARAAR